MSPTTRERRPLVIAHRGSSCQAPENTIAAFELALAQGADALELDVHLSRDDQPVVIHDFELDRTSNGSGPVRGWTTRELKRLDVGRWRGPQFTGQRIQTLQEVLERFRERTRFWIELKAGSDTYPDIEERVVSLLEVYGVLERAFVQSFVHGSLARIRTLNPGARVGALLAEGMTWSPLPGPGEVDALCPDFRGIDANQVSRIREAGLACYVWTVNEPGDMDRLVSWGVEGIITDRPDLLRARLGR